MQTGKPSEKQSAIEHMTGSGLSRAAVMIQALGSQERLVCLCLKNPTVVWKKKKKDKRKRNGNNNKNLCKTHTFLSGAKRFSSHLSTSLTFSLLGEVSNLKSIHPSDFPTREVLEGLCSFTRRCVLARQGERENNMSVIGKRLVFFKNSSVLHEGARLGASSPVGLESSLLWSDWGGSQIRGW